MTKPETLEARNIGFPAAVREEIIERLIRGEPLDEIVADEAMPAESTIVGWLRDNKQFDLPKTDPEDSELVEQEADGKGFRDRLFEAFQTQVHIAMMGTLRTVGDDSGDLIGEGPDARPNAVAVARHKLKAEYTLKVAERVLSRFAPRQKLTTEEGGEERPLMIAAPMRVPHEPEG